MKGENKKVGRPKGSKNAPGVKVGRPKGSKNKEGSNAGRPVLEDKKITKSIVMKQDMINDIEKYVEGKNFSDRIRIITEFYFKNN